MSRLLSTLLCCFILSPLCFALAPRSDSLDPVDIAQMKFQNQFENPNVSIPKEITIKRKMVLRQDLIIVDAAEIKSIEGESVRLWFSLNGALKPNVYITKDYFEFLERNELLFPMIFAQQSMIQTFNKFKSTQNVNRNSSATRIVWQDMYSLASQTYFFAVIAIAIEKHFPNIDPCLTDESRVALIDRLSKKFSEHQPFNFSSLNTKESLVEVFDVWPTLDSIKVQVKLPTSEILLSFPFSKVILNKYFTKKQMISVLQYMKKKIEDLTGPESKSNFKILDPFIARVLHELFKKYQNFPHEKAFALIQYGLDGLPKVAGMMAAASNLILLERVILETESNLENADELVKDLKKQFYELIVKRNSKLESEAEALEVFTKKVPAVGGGNFPLLFSFYYPSENFPRGPNEQEKWELRVFLLKRQMDRIEAKIGTPKKCETFKSGLDDLQRIVYHKDSIPAYLPLSPLPLESKISELVKSLAEDLNNSHKECFKLLLRDIFFDFYGIRRQQKVSEKLGEAVLLFFYPDAPKKNSIDKSS